jgi:hypothetical protein
MLNLVVRKVTARLSKVKQCQIWNENVRFEITTLGTLKTERKIPVEILVPIQIECARSPVFNSLKTKRICFI